MKPHLTYLKPVIVHEECDILIPDLDENEYYSSVDWIKQYVLKLGRRHHCFLMFIVQDPKRCDPVIEGEFDYLIQHQRSYPFEDRGIFTFQMKGSTYREWFVPYDTSSQFENYRTLTPI